jgi:aryl-alcohol dehydrogenase-like predicted oxidoreductase
MRSRKLGTVGPEVSEIGLGAMGMSEYYGRGDEDEAIASRIEEAFPKGAAAGDRYADMSPINR